MADISLTTITPPASLCGRPLSEVWPDLVALIVATLDANIRNFNYGPTQPAAERQSDPWFKTDAMYKPERWYTFSGGLWLARHAVAPGIICEYLGSEASIPTFDGGDGTAVVTDTSGPMWKKADEFDAKFPVGIGTLPSTTLLAVNATGGEEKHVLTQAELPIFTPATAAGGTFYVYVPGTGTFTLASGPGTDATSSGMNPIGSGDSHNNMPPYRACIFLRRTARLFYRAI